jgi:hypothetical protein
MMRVEPFKRVIAYARCTDITKSDTPGHAHPHLHVFLLMPRGSTQNLEVKELWQRCAQLDYSPTVHWSKGNMGWFRYLTKSPIKVTPKMIDDPLFLIELARQTAGARLFAVGKKFKLFLQAPRPRKHSIPSHLGERYEWSVEQSSYHRSVH